MIYKCIKYVFLFILVFNVITGCNSNEKIEEAARGFEKKTDEHSNAVDVLILKEGAYYNEIVANGKIKALHKSNLTFKISGELKDLFVKNGSYTFKNQVIASLDKFKYQQKLKDALLIKNLAKLELEDLLLNQGFRLKDSVNIPKDIYNMVLLRSGFEQANRNVEVALFDLNNAELRAPFDGKIVNLKYNTYENLNAGDILCSILDVSEFQVEFYLTENEISDISEGNKIKIIPFAFEDKFNGYISEVNPLIGDNGLVLVKGIISGKMRLIEGMNVKVFVLKGRLKNKLMVPKSAIVFKQDQAIIFKYSKGKAIWTYVTIDSENSNVVSISPITLKSENLMLGDTVIVSNNTSIVHNSSISIKKLLQ